MIDGDVDTHCASLRGATLDFPFGPEVKIWKVGRKMFAAYATDGSGVSVKCRTIQSASVLIALGRATQPDYLRGGGWVMVGWNRPHAEIMERLTTSYEVVLSTLSSARRLSAGSVGR